MGFLASTQPTGYYEAMRSHDLVQETVWTPEFVQGLESIAYSNSVVEVVPFCQVMDLNGNINLDGAKLRACFRV